MQEIAVSNNVYYGQFTEQLLACYIIMYVKSFEAEATTYTHVAGALVINYTDWELKFSMAPASVEISAW